MTYDEQIIVDEIGRSNARASSRFGLIEHTWEGAWWVATRPWWSPIVTLTRFAGTRDRQAPTGERVRITLPRFWRLVREVKSYRYGVPPRARVVQR